MVVYSEIVGIQYYSIVYPVKKMEKVFLLFLMLLPSVVLTGDVINVASKVYSKKSTCEGLHLSATDTFKPVTCLTTTIHIDKRFSVFIHYQMTMATGSGRDFHSKLLINYANAGSIVHSGVHGWKTPTGFYMANLNPGYYTIEVHYKSPVAVNVGASLDWQTAILQVMWFEDALAVSDNIKCYPTPTVTNSFDNLGPLKDLEVTLQIPGKRAILSAYQLSAELASPNYIVTALDVNGFYQRSSVFLKGPYNSLLLHGVWADNYRTGIHYFNLLYRTPVKFSFTDCNEDTQGLNNKNLYVMMLPVSCKVYKVSPASIFTPGRTNRWAATDVTYSLVLSKQSHIIVMYQYAGRGGGTAPNSHFVTRLSINSVPLKHTATHSADTTYVGNFGMWQGPLSTGTHKLTLEYRTPKAGTNHPEPTDWQTRTMTIISCS